MKWAQENSPTAPRLWSVGGDDLCHKWLAVREMYPEAFCQRTGVADLIRPTSARGPSARAEVSDYQLDRLPELWRWQWEELLVRPHEPDAALAPAFSFVTAMFRDGAEFDTALTEIRSMFGVVSSLRERRVLDALERVSSQRYNMSLLTVRLLPLKGRSAIWVRPDVLVCSRGLADDVPAFAAAIEMRPRLTGT